MRLLPPDPALGWKPYIWLIYVFFFVAYPFAVATGAWEYAAQAVGLAAFLALYFRAHWTDGSERLPFILAIAGLGVLFTPINPGALVFFIYAAAFVGGARTGRAAGAWIGGLTVAAVAAAAMSGWSQPALLGSVAVITPVIGFVNLHDAEVRTRDASLRMAHDEIARLAAREERDRIAADLHDLLGHTLSVIVLKAELASKLMERDPARAAIEVRDVERISRDALGEVRSAVQGFRAASLRDEIARARKVLATAGIALEAAEAPQVGEPRVEHALAMVLREAVTNVLRHSKAARCRIAFAAADGALMLEVADDGVGGVAADGGGLEGMRARVRELGGSLEIGDATAAIGHSGTTVTARLPRGEGR